MALKDGTFPVWETGGYPRVGGSHHIRLVFDHLPIERSMGTVIGYRDRADIGGRSSRSGQRRRLFEFHGHQCSCGSGVRRRQVC